MPRSTSSSSGLHDDSIAPALGGSVGVFKPFATSGYFTSDAGDAELAIYGLWSYPRSRHPVVSQPPPRPRALEELKPPLLPCGELSALDALSLVGFDSRPSSFADPAGRKDLSHRRPVGLNPSAIMTAIAVGRHADLSEAQLRAVAASLQLKNRNRIVIGPPPRRAPGLHNPLSRLEHKIDAADV